MKFSHSSLGLLNANSYSNAGTQYLVQTPTGNLYAFWIDNIGNDVCWAKSTDGGITWSQETAINSGFVMGFAVWYDKWSGLSTGLIHLVYNDSTPDDILYRTIDTENSDALSTETTVAALTSSATPGGQLSVVRSRGGNVYCRVCIDAGAEGGFYRLPNANVPNGAWDAARTINEALATLDQMILMPGFAADNQDLIGIFWDVSADEISRQLHDDSANSWAETSIATTMVELAASTGWPNFAAAPDLANNRIVLVAWSGTDLANADLRCWTITESAITEKTNVVQNSTDDQSLCGVSIDINSGRWYVFYCGKSDGSETYATIQNIYYKYSDDAGTTWSSELALTTDNYGRIVLTVCPRMYNGLFPVVASQITTGTPDSYKVTAPIRNRRSSFQLGL